MYEKKPRNILDVLTLLFFAYLQLVGFHEMDGWKYVTGMVVYCLQGFILQLTQARLLNRFDNTKSINKYTKC